MFNTSCFILGRMRIAHVPNVASLLNAKKNIFVSKVNTSKAERKGMDSGGSRHSHRDERNDEVIQIFFSF